MEFITEESLSVYSQVLIPIFLVIISGALQVIIKIYLSSREKNQYVKLLKINFPSVKLFLDRIKEYKIDNEYLLPYIYFAAGLALGCKIEIILAQIIAAIFAFIFEIDYIENIMYSIFNIENLNHLSEIQFNYIRLNISMVYYSCLNVSVFAIILVFSLWRKFIKSRNFLEPKFANSSINAYSSHVYFSYWLFIGITFGVSITVYILSLGNLLLCSVIDNNSSFNRALFTDIHTNLEPNLLYPVFHLTMYLLGFTGSALFICWLYCVSIKPFSDRVMELITRYYRCDFPYVKIKTESGEIEGLLKDIRNRSLVTLSENNVLRIVPWDKIETMEAIQRNKKEQLIFCNTSPTIKYDRLK